VTRLRTVVFSAILGGLGLVAAAYYFLWPRAETPVVIVEYGFCIHGAVVAADGRAIPEVEVTLDLPSPVYEAITPVQHAERMTDAAGKFQFSYIACSEPVKSYTVTCRKPGYHTSVLRDEFDNRSVHRITMLPLSQEAAAASSNTALRPLCETPAAER
jgi:hypothetical protein